MSMVGVRSAPLVPNGPRAFRSRIRRLGPFAALVPAALLGTAALVLLHHNATTARGLAGFGATVLAAPVLPAFGVPLTDGSQPFLLGIVASIVFWLLLGLVAARRATRSPVASWRDFWREFLWLAAGVWAGVIAALVVVEVVLGGALF